jgi:hypothetical protein
MPSVSDLIWWVFIGLLAIILIVSAFLDWIGRVEIIERKFPKIWGVLTNKATRLLLLLFVLGLLAEDVHERLHEKEPPPLVFVSPAIPPPIIQNVIGQQPAALPTPKRIGLAPPDSDRSITVWNSTRALFDCPGWRRG